MIDSQYLRLPPPAEDKIKELWEIVNENPSYLPLPVVAKFMGANAEGLRCSIERGRCPFGIEWQKESTYGTVTYKGNKAFKIPSATFFLWYTGGAGYKQ